MKYTLLALSALAITACRSDNDTPPSWTPDPNITKVCSPATEETPEICICFSKTEETPCLE